MAKCDPKILERILSTRLKDIRDEITTLKTNLDKKEVLIMAYTIKCAGQVDDTVIDPMLGDKRVLVAKLTKLKEEAHEIATQLQLIY